MKKGKLFFRQVSIGLMFLFFLCGIAVLPANAQVFEENFEAGWGSWYADNGVWEVGTPTAGPAAPHGGTQCAGTVLGGDYPGYTDSRLISPSINLPNVTGNEEIHLRFWSWHCYGSGDGGYTQISVYDDGAGTWSNWTTLGSPVTSYSGVWSPRSDELTSYAGKKVRLGFYHASDCCGVCTGWYIDDVELDFPDCGTDNDGDGYCVPDDCDDNDPNVHPGAVEICDDLIDNDCDGLVDCNDPDCSEKDNDSDGYIAEPCGDDCDDNDGTVYPSAPELCDGKDNDCDGLIDEGCPDGCADTTYARKLSYIKFSTKALRDNASLRMCINDDFCNAMQAGPDKVVLNVNDCEEVEIGGDEIESNASKTKFLAVSSTYNLKIDCTGGWLYLRLKNVDLDDCETNPVKFCVTIVKAGEDDLCLCAEAQFTEQRDRKGRLKKLSFLVNGFCSP